MPRDGSGAVRPSLVRSNVEQRLLNLPAEGHDERPAPDDTPRDCGDLQGEVRRGPLDRGVVRGVMGVWGARSFVLWSARRVSGVGVGVLCV